MKNTNVKRLVAAALALTLSLGFAACGSTGETSSAPAAADTAADTTQTGSSDGSGTSSETTYSPENPVTVKLGLTASIYEDIWNPIKEKVAAEGINLEYVQFSDYALPNEALENGEIDITSHQHHAYFNNQIAQEGWTDLTSIGDTFIIAMNLYSDKIKSVDEIQDGDKISVPNDASNEGRALKLLANAGIITLKADAGANPEINDIETYNKKVELVELNASDTVSSLPDVTAAVINGNYALDAGIDPTTAIYNEEKYDDDSYFCLLAVREADKDRPELKRLVELFQSDDTKKIFDDEFKGYFKPAWEYKFDEQ